MSLSRKIDFARRGNSAPTRTLGGHGDRENRNRGWTKRWRHDVLEQRDGVEMLIVSGTSWVASPAPPGTRRQDMTRGPPTQEMSHDANTVITQCRADGDTSNLRAL